jgi:hypothetical protein
LRIARQVNDRPAAFFLRGAENERVHVLAVNAPRSTHAVGHDKIRRAVDSGAAMDFANSNDQSLLSFYESVRRQVEADKCFERQGSLRRRDGKTLCGTSKEGNGTTTLAIHAD